MCAGGSRRGTGGVLPQGDVSPTPWVAGLLLTWPNARQVLTCDPQRHLYFRYTLSFDHPPRVACILRPEDKLLVLWGQLYSHLKIKQMHYMAFWGICISHIIYLPSAWRQCCSSRLGFAGSFLPQQRFPLSAGMSCRTLLGTVSHPGFTHRNHRSKMGLCVHLHPGAWREEHFTFGADKELSEICNMQL